MDKLNMSRWGTQRICKLSSNHLSRSDLTRRDRLDNLQVQQCTLTEKERQIHFEIVFCTMCNRPPHSSCVCQPASWHYHQSKAFLELVGGGSYYCAAPYFAPKTWVKNGKIGRQSDKGLDNFSVRHNISEIPDRAFRN